MKYQIEYLSRNNFLRDNGAIPVGEGSSMIYFGLFPLTEFADLKEFSLFTQNISSLSQAWYPSNDLDDAYGWYIPDERKDVWTDKAEKLVGAPRDWIISQKFALPVDSQLPTWSGDFYVLSSEQDFSIVGISDSGYFDIFLAEAL